MRDLDGTRAYLAPCQRWVERRRVLIALPNPILMLGGIALSLAFHHDERLRWIGAVLFTLSVGVVCLLEAARRHPQRSG